MLNFHSAFVIYTYKTKTNTTMSKREKKSPIVKCYCAVDKNSDIVTFYKKSPKMTEEGIFYGDEMFEYTTKDFPFVTFENSPLQASYDGSTGNIKVKH